MPKAVCRLCEVELRPETNGVYVVDLMDRNTQPYRLTAADLWKCPRCGYEVVLGFAGEAFMYHHEGDIQGKLNELVAAGAVVIYNKD